MKDKPRNSFYVVFVGANKARRGEGDQEQFSDDEKGQIESYLEEVLQLQPNRVDVTGKFCLLIY